MTPFEVEYARSSRTRAGAPSLVPVPDPWAGECGRRCWVLKPDVNMAPAKTVLCRREIHAAGNTEVVYDEAVQSRRRGAVRVAELPGLCGLPVVLYTDLRANIPVVRPKKPPEIKAQELTRQAIESLTAETYAKRTDGIRYLADAIANGIETPLPPYYRVVVLALAGGAPDLGTARMGLAQERDWTPWTANCLAKLPRLLLHDARVTAPHDLLTVGGATSSPLDPKLVPPSMNSAIPARGRPTKKILMSRLTLNSASHLEGGARVCRKTALPPSIGRRCDDASHRLTAASYPPETPSGALLRSPSARCAHSASPSLCPNAQQFLQREQVAPVPQVRDGLVNE